MKEIRKGRKDEKQLNLQQKHQKKDEEKQDETEEEVSVDAEESEEKEEEASEEDTEEEEAEVLEKGTEIKVKQQKKKVTAQIVKHVDGEKYKVKIGGKQKTLDLSKETYELVKTKKVAKKNKKGKKGKVEAIVGHRRFGSKMQLKVRHEGNDATQYVDEENLKCSKKMLSDYKKKVRAEVEERNKERQERREAAKPETKPSKRGRSVKRVNYSLKALQEAYEPVSSDSEDDFDLAEKALEKEERRKEAARLASERKANKKRKRGASKKKTSNKRRKKAPVVD